MSRKVILIGVPVFVGVVYFGFLYLEYKHDVAACVDSVYEIDHTAKIEFPRGTEITNLQNMAIALEESAPELKETVVLSSEEVKEEFIKRHEGDDLTITALRNKTDEELEAFFPPQLRLTFPSIRDVDVEGVKNTVESLAKENGVAIDRMDLSTLTDIQMFAERLEKTSFRSYIASRNSMFDLRQCRTHVSTN